MTDNYIGKQQEQYKARETAWKQAQKYGKRKTATSGQIKTEVAGEIVSKPDNLKKRILATGGAEDIRKAVVEAFCKDGHQVTFCDINAVSGQQTARDTGAISHPVDVNDKGALGSCMQQILDEWKDIDILIDSVSTSKFSPITETSVGDFDRILSANLRPVLITSRLFVIHRKGQSGSNSYGRIINTCPTRYLMSEPGDEGYAASKGGIYSLTHVLALSLSEWSITVNPIVPGWIQTQDYDQLRPEDHSQHPSRRADKPKDAAHMCLFLCWDGDDSIGGENITIDGGMTKKMTYTE